MGPLYNPCEHIHNAQLPFADVQSDYCFIEAGVTPPCVETCSSADGPPGSGPPYVLFRPTKMRNYRGLSSSSSYYWCTIIHLQGRKLLRGWIPLMYQDYRGHLQN